jgi:hypothetical protein
MYNQQNPKRLKVDDSLSATPEKNNAPVIIEPKHQQAINSPNLSVDETVVDFSSIPSISLSESTIHFFKNNVFHDCFE